MREREALGERVQASGVIRGQCRADTLGTLFATDIP